MAEIQGINAVVFTSENGRNDMLADIATKVAYFEEEDYRYPVTDEQLQMIKEIPPKGMTDKVVGLIIVHDSFKHDYRGSIYEEAVMRVVAVTEKGYEVRIPKIRGIGKAGGPRKCFKLINSFSQPLLGKEIAFYKRDQYHNDSLGGYYTTQVLARVKSLPEDFQGARNMYYIQQKLNQK